MVQNREEFLRTVNHVPELPHSVAQPPPFIWNTDGELMNKPEIDQYVDNFCLYRDDGKKMIKYLFHRYNEQHQCVRQTLAKLAAAQAAQALKIETLENQVQTLTTQVKKLLENDEKRGKQMDAMQKKLNRSVGELWPLKQEKLIHEALLGTLESADNEEGPEGGPLPVPYHIHKAKMHELATKFANMMAGIEDMDISE